MRFLLFSLSGLFHISAVLAQNQLPARTHSLHHVDAFLFGAGYAYECPTSSQLTISSGLSLFSQSAGTYFWSDFDRKFWGLSPCVSIDLRWYSNFNKRVSKEKTVYNNSANYWSLLLDYILDQAVIGDDNIIYQSFVIITPRWGLRRSFNQHFFFEFSTGLGFRITHIDTSPYFHVDLKVSYGFGQK